MPAISGVMVLPGSPTKFAIVQGLLANLLIDIVLPCEEMGVSVAQTRSPLSSLASSMGVSVAICLPTLLPIWLA